MKQEIGKNLAHWNVSIHQPVCANDHQGLDTAILLVDDEQSGLYDGLVWLAGPILISGETDQACVARAYVIDAPGHSDCSRKKSHPRHHLRGPHSHVGE